MFGRGGYGAGGGPGGFISGGGFSHAEQSKMMFANMDEDEFDDDDYDYDDEDDYGEDISATESELMALQMEQQRQVQAQAKAQAMSYQGPGSKPLGSSLYGGAGSMGGLGSMGGMGGAGAFQAGGTQFGAGTMGGMGGAGAMGGLGGAGGGGFTYGAASSGGNLFGAASAAGNSGLGGTQFGAPSAASGVGGGTAGLFNFGGASQFGSMTAGGGAGSFQTGATSFSAGAAGGALGGAAASDDPYANIAIDLSKVKAAPVAAKPFEAKTEEEKMKDAEARGSIKSNLKTTKADFAKAAENKKEVRFGKSTTYQVPVGDNEGGTYNTADMDKDGRGSPRPGKQIIKETDLSDGRDEKEKILAQMEKDKEEQRQEQEMMEKWKKQQEEKEKEGSGKNSIIDQMRIDRARLQDLEESGNSSSLSVPQAIGAKAKVEESYTSDDFEESVSLSQSGSKKFDRLTGLTKPIPQASKKIEDSLKSDTSGYSVSNSKSIGDLKSNSRVGESSDVYTDDDFESVSKSNKQMNKILPTVQKLTTLKSIESNKASPTKLPTAAAITSIAQTYTRKENKQTMTDEGKYSYMSASNAAPSNLKEFTLKKNLEEAEHLIQELKSLRAEDRDNIRELEVKLTKKDGDYQAARREALGSGETVKSIREQLADTRHKNDLYKIETERLIKEIDMADAKTREKDNDLVLAQAEYDRKLKLQEERILYRRGKNEDRTMLDLKQEHALTIEHLRQQNDEKQEEIDYLNEKKNQLDVRVEQLTLAKDQKGEVKKLEAQVAMMQVKIEEHENLTKVKTDFSTCKGNLSAAQQVELQKEVAQFSRIIDGLNEENQRAEAKLRDVTFQLKQNEKKLREEKKLTQDLQLKQMLDKKKVYVEGQADEVSISTANLMGPDNSISQKDLKELQDRVSKLVLEKDDMTRDWVAKESTLKSLNDQVRAQKVAVEKQLIESEFLVGQRNQEISVMRQQNMAERELNETKIKELESKIAFFLDNQKILSEQQKTITQQNRELNNMKNIKLQAEDDREKRIQTENRCKILEETIKKRNPDSIPMLIQASKRVKQEEDDDQGKKQLKFRIQSLEAELEDKEKDFTIQIRSIRQELARQQQIYEQRSANPAEAKKVNELEKELTKQKEYYVNRIREIENKHRYGGAQQKKTTKTNEEPLTKLSQAEVKQLQDRVIELEQKNAQLHKERNHFADKLVLNQQSVDRTASPETQIGRSVVTFHEEPPQRQQMSQMNKLQTNQVQKKAKLNPFLIDEEDKLSNFSNTSSAQPPITSGRSGMEGHQRSVPQLMQVLKRINLRNCIGRHVKIPEAYQVFNGQLSIDEIKSIKHFLSTKRQGTTIDPDDCAIEVANDRIDMDDLIEAIQFKQDFDELQPDVAPRQQSFGVQGAATGAELDSLQRKIARILREKDDDAEFYSSKIRQLKRNLKEATLERGELQEQVDRLEANKIRLEKFYKDKMGITLDGNKSLAETLQNTKTGELIGEVGIIARRIEYMEEQADARNRQQQGDHGPCKREIARLNQELEQERSSRTVLIGKKNAEISYFKAELDGLLSELANTSAGSSPPKSVLSAYRSD